MGFAVPKPGKFFFEKTNHYKNVLFGQGFFRSSGHNYRKKVGIVFHARTLFKMWVNSRLFV